ncbi:YitT family protein [Bacteroides sp.]|uniref:YitT family protein n=1 Tax=Bacteroides sp. TaxID=29523 RepID=UPI002FC8A322
MDKNKLHSLYYSIHDYLIIIIGTLLYGFGFNGFILSNEIVTGGVSGICALIFFATAIPVSISYFLINVVLLAIAFRILGLKFLVKTIFGVICLSLSLSLFEWLMAGNPILQDEPFMSIIIGAFLCGSGLGLIFSANGSTGGTDIIGAVVNKYKNISIGRALLFCDFIIISSSFLLFHNVEKIVFGFVEMVVSNYVLDMVLNGNRQSVQFLIFSQKYDEIAESIIKDLGRGCTILDGVGGYSKKAVKVVVLLAKKSESVFIFRLVKEVDPQAFISQSIVRGVYGEGFDQIKT